jgi:multiple sugar transport system permease protein
MSMRFRRTRLSAYLMVSPYLLQLAVFVAFPVIFSFVLMFHRWNIISPMEFIGLRNFEILFQDRIFFKAIYNTLIFLFIHIPSQIVLALFLAEMLNQKIKFRAFFRASYFLPVVISGVVVTIVWQQLYGLDLGLLNRMLTAIGLDRVGWLTDPRVAMPSIAIMATWKNVGLYVVLFLVGLQGVPAHFYEAADIDGASHWQKFRFITLPAIKPTLFMVFVLSTLGGFSLFIEPYIMTGGGPMNSTISAMLYIYKQGFTFYHMGYAAALGFFFAAIIMLVVVIQKKLIDKD